MDKHIIIGTAGHIDHGKTTLIRALTGRNTDRLKEEEKRGISIELGFTYFDLPDGQRAGIIDVPGHEKFVRNMLAGVIGIDIVILVVAADEGIMPQTSEHLAILDLLGIEKGFLVMTKADLVEDEWMDLVEEEIYENVKGTFLENSPVIRVSSTNNEGLDEVKDLLQKYSKDIEDKTNKEEPRLPVDRSFIISGFGTVVTGTLLSGTLEIGEEIQIYPGDTVGRIRTLQVHDEDAEIAYAGQRVAINIAGIKKEDVDRGSVIAPIGSMKETMMLDVKVKLLESMDRSIENRTRVRLYLGTEEILCRLVLLDREELFPGEEAYAQLRLEKEVVAKLKDKFILRFYSPMYTIGGGIILDPNPSKKKRYDEGILEELAIKDKGSKKDVIERIIKDRRDEFLSIKDISSNISISEEELEAEIKSLNKEGKIISFPLTNETYYIHNDHYLDIKDNIVAELEDHHEKFPLRNGIPKEQIRSKFLRKANTRIGELFIDRITKEGYIEQDLENVKLKGFSIEFNEKNTKIKNDIFNILKEDKFLPSKNYEIAERLDYKREEFDEVYNVLINLGELIKITDDMAMREEDYKKAIKELEDYITNNGSISVAEYRDLLDTNRRTAIGLLEYFDQQKITIRDDDTRTLYKN
ncbi:MAG TPA: selenocysteine-specific translation elongation factor [Tissierellaceae bacterium]|nr:selenocysteine-specific translation elongation factor [Tissierellaceae bacterium]